MALDAFNPYLYVSAGEQSNKFLTPAYSGGIVSFQAQRAQELAGLTVQFSLIQEGTGDPAPDNIRPISGRTGLTVTVQSGETQNEYPVTWETEAGTVYGGTLDVVSGVLTVDKVLITFDGTGVTWGKYTPDTDNYCFRATISDMAVGSTPMYANSYKWLTEPAWGTSDYGIFSGHPVYAQVYFRPPDASVEEVADWNAWLAANNLQVVYPLATPQTYQLTGADVKTLAGYNQIYSDAGPVIDIKF